MKIIDKKTGSWVYNQGEHRIPDYVRQCDHGGDLVIIEPGVPTKIDFTESLRANTNLIEIEDPTQTDGIVPKAPEAEKPKSGKGKVAAADDAKAAAAADDDAKPADEPKV